MLVYGKYECFVMHMLYVCVLCVSCGISQCWFCMTCSLLMLDEDARDDHVEEAPNDTAWKRCSCDRGAVQVV